MIHIRGKCSKYGNKKVEIDGFKFDSQKEAKRYQELKLAQTAQEIFGLRVHPKFDINVNGVKVCAYIADFEYYQKGNFAPKRIIEDVKGVRTAAYQLKKKFMLAVHGISIVEV